MKKSMYSPIYEEAKKLGFFIYAPVKRKICKGLPEIADYTIEFLHIDNERKLIDIAGFGTMKYCGTIEGFIEAVKETFKNDKVKEFVPNWYGFEVFYK